MSDSSAACERVRKHLDQGAPWDACDAFREEVEQRPDDADLLYFGALAYARAGATGEAHAVLDRAQRAAPAAGDRRADILSLRGRLWKDALHRAADDAIAAPIAAHARDEYLSAYALADDPYPGINAATLSLLLGDRATAQSLAAKIVADLANVASRSPWDLATEGEAYLLLGHIERAQASYRAAYASMGRDAGSVATVRRQLRLIARELPDAATLLPALRAPDVLAFAGHMIDAPDRLAPRFPAALEPAVTDALRNHLRELHAPIVYASAACGADLIAIEQASALGAEVNIVLPFDRDDFVRTSVSNGGPGWIERFDDALRKATRVIAATEEKHLGDDVLFEHAALQVEGLARLRATQLETSAALLCVIDSSQPGRIGGTRASFDRWRAGAGNSHSIDLRQLRAVQGLAGVASAGASDSAPLADRGHRTLKTLLFADVAGYSKLPDAFVAAFQQSFWTVAAREIDALPVRPLLANTWGDALYLVFEMPRDGADLATRLLAATTQPDWTGIGLPAAQRVRIALHAGPVFRGYDPVMGRDNFFGSAVNRAARIEPVTPPGTVYASEAFAATLAATGAGDYALEYTGLLKLAKGYGESRIYRVERR